MTLWKIRSCKVARDTNDSELNMCFYELLLIFHSQEAAVIKAYT